jgi:YbbR domain-containing protein
VSLRSHLSNNLTLKIASVIVAVVLWAFAKGEQTADRRFAVPLVLRNVPEGLTPVERVPETVDVVLRGANKELVKLGLWGESYATVDMTAAAADRVLRVGISAANVVLPHDAGVTVTEIVDPKSLDIEIDRRFERLLPVDPVIEGAPAEGYYVLGRPVAIPETVTVYGPARVVRDLESVRTEPLPIDGRRGRVEASRPVVCGGPWNLHAVPKDVRINVEIEGTEVARISDVQLLLQHEPVFDSVSIEPVTIEVQLAGPEHQVTRLEAADITARVDARGLPRGVHELVPEIEVPPGITVLNLNPVRLTVTLQ